MRLITTLLICFLLASCAHSAADSFPVANDLSMSEAHYAAELNQQGVQVIKLGDTLALILPSDQFFQLQIATLNPQQISTLTLIAQLLKAHGYPAISVIGHTDDVGSTSDKLALSEQQAQVIASYLWSQGIPLSRMSIKGAGDAQPVANNITASTYNRRIEIIAN